MEKLKAFVAAIDKKSFIAGVVVGLILVELGKTGVVS